MKFMVRCGAHLVLGMLLLPGCVLGAEPPEAGTEAGSPRPAAEKDLPDDGAAATVTVKDAPELSGRFWVGDLMALPPATAVTVTVPGLSGFELSGPAGESDGDPWARAGGTARQGEAGSIELITPRQAESMYRLTVNLDGGREPLRFRLVVLHQASITRNERTGQCRVTLDGKAIGTYPDPESAESWRVRMHHDLYKPPRFWMRITAQNQDLDLAPHVRVGQMVGFITEKDKTKPKVRHTDWFPPNRPLVYKLEMLNRELAASGLKFTRLAINSAFRTPYYNRRVGGSSFSRHIYGDAVDAMIDENWDEVCDDITGDAKADERDGLVLGQAARKVEAAGRVALGGLGVYGFDGDESCRSYLHLDTRGYVTRWGYVYRGRSRRLTQWWPAEEYREDEEPPPEFRDPKAQPGTSPGASGE